MEIGDKYVQGLFERFDKHALAYTYLLIAAYLFLNNTVNASSVWIEHNRQQPVAIQLWEPYVWEYSSALSTLVLLPLVFRFYREVPLSFQHIPRQIALHAIATVLFSLSHVALMVMMRKIVYWSVERSYEFSPWLAELWYEYRKDAWGYVFWLLIYHVAIALYKRLKGEASLLERPGSDDADIDHGNWQSSPEHLLVRKLDKEFVVKVADIEWLESSGNYVNLHKAGRIYPLRGTLAKTHQRLDKAGFCRVHRRYAVNLEFVNNIQYQTSGDGTITLTSGQELPLSRRYKDEFKSLLS